MKLGDELSDEPKDIYYASNEVAAKSSLQTLETQSIPGDTAILVGNGMLLSLLPMLLDKQIYIVDKNISALKYIIQFLNIFIQSDSIAEFYENLEKTFGAERFEFIKINLEEEVKEHGEFHYLYSEDNFAKAKSIFKIVKDKIYFRAVNLIDVKGMREFSKELIAKKAQVGLVNLTNVHQYVYNPLLTRLFQGLPIDKYLSVLYSSSETKNEANMRAQAYPFSTTNTRSRITIGIQSYLEKSDEEERRGHV